MEIRKDHCAGNSHTTPASSSTRYRISSHSGVFAACAIMRLYEDGDQTHGDARGGNISDAAIFKKDSGRRRFHALDYHSITIKYAVP